MFSIFEIPGHRRSYCGLLCSDVQVQEPQNINSPAKGTEKASRNSGHKDTKFLGNMCFGKKNNKDGLKKMLASNAKAVSECAEALTALVKPQAIKSKMSNGPSHNLSPLALIAHPKLGNEDSELHGQGS